MRADIQRERLEAVWQGCREAEAQGLGSLLHLCISATLRPYPSQAVSFSPSKRSPHTCHLITGIK